MSGQVGTDYYCLCCDRKFNYEKDFNTHCSGKKHKQNERIKSERDAAACSLMVRGAKGKNPEEVLASYFCQFGLLAKVSLFNPQAGTMCRVQFVDVAAVQKALAMGSVHHHNGLKLQVLQFEYKPHNGDAARLAHQEELRKAKMKKSKLHSQINQILAGQATIQDQIRILTERLELTPKDLEDRQEIADRLKQVFTVSYPGCSVYQFGSSMNGFGMSGCDLDLYLHLTQTKNAANQQIKLLSKMLSARQHSSMFGDIMVIPSMRCPIIKFTHKPTGLKCDLSLDNRKALHNSCLLRLYSGLPAVRHLVFAVRLWAKFRGLSGHGGASAPSHLSSYALTLLVVFYLSRMNYVPDVASLENVVSDTKVEVVDECRCLIFPDGAQLPAPQKPLSAVELLHGFFKYFSEEIDWETDGLLMRNAKLIPRATLIQHFTYLNCKLGSMTVVDPYNLKHNVAANVSEAFRQRFDSELRRAAKVTSSWRTTPGQNDEKDAVWGLMELLEEVDQSSTTGDGGDKADQAEKKKETKDSPSVGAGKNNKTPSRLEGEQLNGEFHVVLPASEITLNNCETVEAAAESGITPSQQWLIWARDFTVNTLETVFFTEIQDRGKEGVEGEEMQTDSREEKGCCAKMITEGEEKRNLEEMKTEEGEEKKEICGELTTEEGQKENRNYQEMTTEEGESASCSARNKRPSGDTELDDSGEACVDVSHTDGAQASDTQSPMKRICHEASVSALQSPNGLALSHSCTLTSVTTTTTLTNFAVSPDRLSEARVTMHYEVCDKDTPCTEKSTTPSKPCSTLNQQQSPDDPSCCQSSNESHSLLKPGATTTNEASLSPHGSNTTSPNDTQLSPTTDSNKDGASSDPLTHMMSGRSLQCRCKHQVWVGRKRLRRDLVMQAHPTALCGSGLILEREISSRSIKEQEEAAETRAVTARADAMIAIGKQVMAERHKQANPQGDPYDEYERLTRELRVPVVSTSTEMILDFSCDLSLHDAEPGSDTSPHLFIKLKPLPRCHGPFKVFYDLFRSIMLRLNACDLNTAE